MGVWMYMEANAETVDRFFYDFDCAIDIHATSAYRELLDTEERWDEYDKIVARAAVRAAGVDALALAIAKASEGQPLIMPEVELATDRLGRPRVHVKFGGSLSSGQGVGVAMNTLTRDWTIPSSRREYVLVPHGSTSPMNRPEDPSQPVVAAVFGAVMKTKTVGGQKEKITQWKSSGIGTPILWLVGPEVADQAMLDKKVLELRGHLSAAGYDGDAALVLSSLELDVPSLTALARTLDEFLDTTTASKRDVETWASALQLLQKSIEDERPEAFCTALGRLHKTLATAPKGSAKDLEAATSLIVRAMIDEPCDQVGLQLLAALNASSAAPTVRRVCESVIARSLRVMPPEFDLCCTLLSSWRDPLFAKVLVSGFLREKSLTERMKTFAKKILLHGDHSGDKTADASVREALIAELKTAMNSMKPKDFRRAEGLELIAQLEALSAVP